MLGHNRSLADGDSLLTLEYGGVLDDETFELSADDLQARLHVVAGGHLVALLHLPGAAAQAFGLANLQIGTWQKVEKEVRVSTFAREARSLTHEPLQRLCSLNELMVIMHRLFRVKSKINSC